VTNKPIKNLKGCIANQKREAARSAASLFWVLICPNTSHKKLYSNFRANEPVKFLKGLRSNPFKNFTGSFARKLLCSLS